MVRAHYRGVPEHGLPLLPSDDPGFSALVRDIQSRPEPFGHWPADDLANAAVMLNQTGRAIVALAYFWRYTVGGGQRRTSTFTNLGSSVQIDFLSGRTSVVPQDWGSFILAGSKRLITERGMYGNNLDVLPPLPKGGGGGYTGSGSGGTRWGAGTDDITAVELVLDAAVLEDGVCLGLDESGLVQRVTADLQHQRATAQQVLNALRGGASSGQIFELLVPLARHSPGEQRSAVLRMFAHTAIHHLINLPQPQLQEHFEQIANSPPLRLRTLKMIE